MFDFRKGTNCAGMSRSWRPCAISRMDSYCIGALLLALTTLASAQSSLHLIPIPREVHATADHSLPKGVHIVCPGCTSNSEDQFAAADLAATFQSRSISTTSASGFRIELIR